MKPYLFEDDAPEANRDDVSKRGGKLGAGDLRGIGGDLAPARDAAILPHDARQSRRRHRGLLGGQRQVEDLHDDKGDGIVGPHQKAFDEQRQVGADDLQFERGGKTVSSPPPAAARHICQYSPSLRAT